PGPLRGGAWVRKEHGECVPGKEADLLVGVRAYCCARWEEFHQRVSRGDLRKHPAGRFSNHGISLERLRKPLRRGSLPRLKYPSEEGLSLIPAEGFCDELGEALLVVSDEFQLWLGGADEPGEGTVRGEVAFLDHRRRGQFVIHLAEQACVVLVRLAVLDRRQGRGEPDQLR